MMNVNTKQDNNQSIKDGMYKGNNQSSEVDQSLSNS